MWDENIYPFPNFKGASPGLNVLKYVLLPLICHTLASQIQIQKYFIRHKYKVTYIDKWRV